MAIKYDLTPVEVVKLFGYIEPKAKERLESSAWFSTYDLEYLDSDEETKLSISLELENRGMGYNG